MVVVRYRMSESRCGETECQKVVMERRRIEGGGYGETGSYGETG